MGKSKLYKQICVTANNSSPCTVAIVFPTVKPTDESSYINEVLEEFEKCPDLRPIEKPGVVIIAKEPFSSENKQMTSTFKLRRKAIHTAYKNDIEQAYQQYDEKTRK